MSTYYVSESDLEGFLEALARETEVYGTVEREERLNYEGLDAENIKLVRLETVRSYASPKLLLFPVAEKVAAYSVAGASEVRMEQPTRVLLGMRQCDLAAIHMLDLVFLEGDYVDPFYKARRDSTVLISTDCRDAAESCFCTLLDGKPYPTDYYDINFSPLSQGCIAETGSEKGKKLISGHEQLFTVPSEEQLKERERNREEMTKKLVGQNKEFEPARPIQEVFAGEIDERKLQKLAWDCVECGACTNICPSCHCFLMFDRPVGSGTEVVAGKKEGAEVAPEAGEAYERVRTWDSCVFGEYARMAGVGGMKPNPRPEFRTRFVNRFLHKYCNFYHMFDQFQCSGCGRCFDACSGGIDPRVVIREMSKKSND